MFLGIDLGTSSVKTILVDESEAIVGQASARLAASHPAPGWSEQAPADWVAAAFATLDELARGFPREMSAVRGIGLSGQMHGATLLDASDEPLRPCILWNDTRAMEECRALEESVASFRAIAANAAMPGFTAPKLLWVRRHEPALHRRIATVLLPKAYLRLVLSGEKLEEMSDASGTLWLDVARRRWSSELLAATGLGPGQVPGLVEGTAPAGRLRPALAARWGMASPPVIAGGAGDNAASAVALAATRPSDSFISLGTSGVVWSTTDGLRPNPGGHVHAFCHALPASWHQMAVMLSAAECLSWWARIVGTGEAALVAEVEASAWTPSGLAFLPYLAGERTPFNDAGLRGMFAGLGAATDRAAMTRAILEGVALSLRDCLEAMRAAGAQVGSAAVVGGGSRVRPWMRVLASVLGIPLRRVAAGEAIAALGAARLGRLCVTGEDPGALPPPAEIEAIAPDAALGARLLEGWERRRALQDACLAAGRMPAIGPAAS